MKVLVTGAFGNIGTSTLEALIAAGHRVRCFDLKTRANLRAARRLAGKAEVVWGDLRRPEDLAGAVRDQEVVVHLAFIIPKLSVTGIESEQHPELARQVNVEGTRNLIRALQAQPRPPRLVFTSSVHVYGRTQDQAPPRTAADPVRPVEHYAQHKVACEAMVRESGLTWSILRFGAVLPLGLRLDPGMFDVPLDNRIEFVHTRDVGEAVASAVHSDAVWGKTLLIGGGPSCQFYYGDMLARLLGALGVGDLAESAFSKTPFGTDWLDTSESQRLLGYQHRDLGDYAREMTGRLGFRIWLIRAFRPLVRLWLSRRSPYLRAARLGGRRRDWRGQVALITGASSGIGAATARRLAKEGMRVALVARRKERLDDLARSIRAQGGEAIVVAADLTLEADRERVVEAVRSAWGEIDVLVNNAGMAWYGFGSDMAWPLAGQMMQLNMSAVVDLTLRFLGAMKRRRRGHVINVGSVAGSLPSQGVAVYAATKSFIDTFTTSLYRELRGSGVRISVVRPGAVATELSDTASTWPNGYRIPAERLAVAPQRVADRIWGLLQRPRRVAYVPAVLRLVPWVELTFGWLIDRIGPLLLRRQLRLAARPVKV